MPSKRSPWTPAAPSRLARRHQRAFAAAGALRGLTADWHDVTNEYRRRSLKAWVGQVHPEFNFDDVHRRALDEVIEHSPVDALTQQDRDAIWRTWPRARCLAGFPCGDGAAAAQVIVASLTLLTTSLVIDVSKKKRLRMGRHLLLRDDSIYKTKPEAYLTAAKCCSSIRRKS